jgi:hypothetical protein
MTAMRCEDCGRAWKCRCDTRGRPCAPHVHATAARVAGWTVWHEQTPPHRSTVLCPTHRTERGITAHATPLP